MEEVWEALEATTCGKKQGALGLGAEANADKRSILHRRDDIMRFLGECPSEISVSELRDALDEYA